MESVSLSRLWPQQISPFFMCFCLVLLGSLKESQAQISFAEQPQDTIAIAGKPISLNCTATAPRIKIRYVWNFDGNKIDADDSRIFIKADGTLYITDVDKTDAGQYQCVASYRDRSAGKRISIKSQKVDLTVHSICSTIKLTSSPQGPQFATGKTITLKCKCSAIPRVTTVWTKDGNPITSGGQITLSGNKLLINNPTIADSGKYRCSVNNSLGTRDSSVYDVQVMKFVDPTLNVEPKPVTKPVGQSVLLDCKASGSPQPTIQWYFGKASTPPLSNTSTYTLFSNGSLLINNIGNDEFGDYKCKAENLVNTINVVVAVTRAYIKRISFQNNYIEYAKVGEEFLLVCKAPGNPQPAITWLKADGGALPPGYDVKNNNTLRNRNMKMADSANLTCTATNMAGSRSSTVQVIASVLPKFNTHPQDMLVEETKEVVLKCAVTSMPTSHIYWERNNEKVMADGNNTVVNGGTLTIKKAKLSDTGMYQCVAQHPSMYDATSNIANLTVLAAVRLSKFHRNDHKFKLGSKDSKIHCFFRGHSPISVTWKKVGSSRLSKTTVPNGEVLTFRDMKMSDGGVYSCTGSNAFSSMTVLIKVSVYIYPEFVLKPKNTTAIIEESVWLHCNATGFPKPKISWGKEEHGGDKLPKERFHEMNNGTLHIEKIRPSDQGRYYCIAANLANFKQITISLKVIKPPVAVAAKSNAMGRTIGIAVGCAAAYIVLVVGLMIYCKSRRAKQQKREQLAVVVGEDDPENCDDNPEMALQPINGKPANYNKMEFPRHDLEALRTLGNGSYGRAFLARASGIKDGERETMVVVKSLIAKDDIIKEDFRREMGALINMDNPHVVSLLGVCRDMDPLYMIFESLEKGDLKQYLLSCYDNGRSTINSSQKLSMCSNILSGMTYLAANNFIHKDVSARNCMVTKDLQVKISFLGLSYDLYNSEYFRFNNILIPLRWMAPEAIFNDDFTEKSDVWSFGVLAWEIYTLGRTPYEDRSDEEVLKCVKDDLRLSKPDNCPDSVASVMTKCWEVEPDNRPTFEKIYAEISEVAVDSHV